MPDHFVDFADNIAIELEFLGVMADKEADAFLAGNEEEAAAIRNAAEAFREKTPYELDWRVRTRRSLGRPQGFLPGNHYHRGADDSAQPKGSSLPNKNSHGRKRRAKRYTHIHGRWAAPI